ncbi:hypothetical protein HKX48_000372 [Thoreauomyces humboldtii]|nr:hypothetical protein HKX48_000372 [Thoreauomyces humboldtii]
MPPTPFARRQQKQTPTPLSSAKPRVDSAVFHERPLTNNWGQGLISTWEDVKARADREGFPEEDARKEVFRKRDKIPRGSTDVSRPAVATSSSHASPIVNGFGIRVPRSRSQDRNHLPALTTTPSPPAKDKQFYDRWSNYDDVPVPAVLRQLIPEEFGSPTAEYPPSPSSSSSGREGRQKSIFTRRSVSRSSPSPFPSSSSPRPFGPPPRASSTKVKGPRDPASRRNGDDMFGDLRDSVTATPDSSFNDISTVNTSSSTITSSAPRRRPRRRSVTDPDPLDAEEFIFMDTNSDAGGTVVYFADPQQRTVQRLATIQRDGDRTISQSSLGHGTPRRKEQETDGRHRVRFNELDPIRPGSYLPKIGTERLLDRTPRRFQEMGMSDDTDQRIRKSENDAGEKAGCRCNIM